MLFENIKTLAKEKGLSIGELERMAGLSNGAIFKWRVSTPKIDSVQAVAKVLKVKVDNISKQADYFECERKITVYNARTDMIILEAEGYMSISNNTDGELVCTVKTGPSEYKKNYIYLNEYTMYVVEDITGTHTDPYHYKLYFHTEIPVTVETKP